MLTHAAVEFAAFYQTSRHAGGDYYDVIALDDHRFAVIVADVSGHGAPAAIVMAMIRAVVHACEGLLDDPVAVLQHLNPALRFLGLAMFATAVYGPRRPGGDLDAVRAGHPPPLLVGPGRRVGLLPAARRACCCSAIRPVACERQDLAPGDRLISRTAR